MCGEQHISRSNSSPGQGSPPRVRGTAATAGLPAVWQRITPACAGNSLLVPFHTASSQDHPRVCGEQITFRALVAYMGGSPPRVRGTAAHRPLPQAQGGITPACAGNRGYYGAASATGKDHPRVCGEQTSFNPFAYDLVGSPPRVRGTGPVVAHGEPGPGITPACAGNRGPGAGGERAGQDHPRVCGEQTHSPAILSTHSGSPPRVRGTARWVLLWYAN